MSLIERYKAIFFDLFFTLVDPVYQNNSIENEYNILKIERDIWEKVCEKQYYERGIGKVVDPYKVIQNIAHEIDSGISQEKLIQATEARINRFKNCLLQVDTDTLNTIAKLKGMQKKIGLISNSDCIDKLGWEESPLAKYFNVTIFSCDIGYIKPDKRIFEVAMSIINEKAKDCLYIGDGGNDELKAAKEEGMTTVLTTNLIKNLWPNRIEKIQQYADYKINGIDELLNLKEGLCGSGSGTWKQDTLEEIIT